METVTERRSFDDQRQQEITSPSLGAQVRCRLFDLVLRHWPLGLTGRKITDQIA
jgi:hypothetical protein